MYRLFLFASLFITCNADAQMIQRTKVLMGTFVSISVDKEDKKFLKPSFEIIKRVDNSLSTYKKNTPIFKLNNSHHAFLNQYSYEALKLSLKYYKETEGYFNIAVGTITKDLYRFGANERIASKSELQKSSTSIKALRFDRHEAFLENGVKIDLGGMGKGFATDKVSEFLLQNKVKKAVVALSGDIRCIGSCKVAVNNPLDETHPLVTFIMRDSGVSTSGNYNRYVQRKKYNHLINPKTKESEQKFISITLVSKLPSATLDAYATAASVMPVKKSYAFLNAQNLAYIILQADKKLIVSKNIDDYVDLLHNPG
ncbi:FAD:protein FMN transferase [Sulfurimonas sp. SWIR-19]|uniref:FAD:protein FMN transferase n=1 Tax=Sulfurimonas sp. SWIR-19 TaxID=2878390 RepID=UPI001CF5AFC2|nr:FAD:protein FMN transferase [Sulfurimonas sp. SWIR-19]UCM99314.1 FAD:protein FMN transferase [Sulfurimonas sp. SWIR-19]